MNTPLALPLVVTPGPTGGFIIRDANGAAVVDPQQLVDNVNLLYEFLNMFIAGGLLVTDEDDIDEPTEEEQHAAADRMFEILKTFRPEMFVEEEVTVQ